MDLPWTRDTRLRCPTNDRWIRRCNMWASGVSHLLPSISHVHSRWI